MYKIYTKSHKKRTSKRGFSSSTLEVNNAIKACWRTLVLGAELDSPPPIFKIESRCKIEENIVFLDCRINAYAAPRQLFFCGSLSCFQEAPRSQPDKRNFYSTFWCCAWHKISKFGPVNFLLNFCTQNLWSLLWLVQERLGKTICATRRAQGLAEEYFAQETCS